MPDPAPLELDSKDLKDIQEGLNKIGDTLNVAVDEQNSDIENKDEQTEKIIKDNIIDKTRIILKPDEKKRYLAISKIFIDEWMSQVKILKESEKKKGLLSGAISLVKKGAKKTWDLMKLPFWWMGKKKDDEEQSWWWRILKLVSGLGLIWFFFGDSIKKYIPDNIKETLTEIAKEVKNVFSLIMEEAEKKWGPEIKEWWEQTKTEMGTNEAWNDIRETCRALRDWIQHPWKGLAEEWGVDKGELSEEQKQMLLPKIEVSQELLEAAGGSQISEISAGTEQRPIQVKDEDRERFLKNRELYKRLEEALKKGAKIEIPQSMEIKTPQLMDQSSLEIQALFQTVNLEELSQLMEQANKIAKMPAAATAANKITLKEDLMENIIDVAAKLVSFFDKENGPFQSSMELIVGQVEQRLRKLGEDISKMNFQNVYGINYNPVYQDKYDQSDHSVKEIVNDYAQGDHVDTFNVSYSHVDMEGFNTLAKNLAEHEANELKALNEQTGHLLNIVNSIGGLSEEIANLDKVAVAMGGTSNPAISSAYGPKLGEHVAQIDSLKATQEMFGAAFQTPLSNSILT